MLVAGSWCDLSVIIIGVSKGTVLVAGSGAEVVLTTEVGSSRVSCVEVGVTQTMEVVVGGGAIVLPEGSTVRRTVLLIVGPGGVTVTTAVPPLTVLDSLVEVGTADLMMSASSEMPDLTDSLLELLELVELVELLVDEVDDAVVDVLTLAVVVSMTGACEAPGMKKLGEMLMG